MSILNFIVNDILKQTPLFMGLVALLGLALQRKSGREIIEGTLKTIVGMLAFNVGTGLLCDSILAINDILKPTLSTSGVYPFPDIATGVALQIDYVGQHVMTVFILGWLLHILIVRIFHKVFKAVYLTVHMMISQSIINILFWHYCMGLTGIPMFTASIIVCVAFWTLMPMLVYKDAMKITNNAFTLAHFNHVGAFLASKIGAKVGDPVKEDADKLKLPGWLSMFSDMTLNLAITMPIFFLIIGGIAVFVANPTAMKAMADHTAGTNWVVWVIMQGIGFAAGTAVLIYGLRMFLAAMVPAFQGFSEKILPGVVPGLDCMAFAPYSPMGASFGFIGNAVAAILVAVILILIKSPVFVFPSLAICFFDGATEGVFGNKAGGWKGALLGGFIGGLILHLGVIALNPVTGPLSASGVQYGNVDTSSFNAVLFWLVKTIGGLFGFGG